MRNLSFCREKADKRYLLAFVIALICSIICGIVLCKALSGSAYLRNLACDYVYNVYNFNNSPLFFLRLLCDAVYFYVVFAICRSKKLKYFSLILIFLRGAFFGIYFALLATVSALGGVMVMIFVYIPSVIVCVLLCYALADLFKCCDKKIIYALPAIFALADGLILLIFVNVVFRVVIIIV